MVAESKLGFDLLSFASHLSVMPNSIEAEPKSPMRGFERDRPAGTNPSHQTNEDICTAIGVTLITLEKICRIADAKRGLGASWLEGRSRL
jgi:hypothetical protein